MKVCFATFDLTCLRYYCPILEVLKDNKDIEFFLYTFRHSNKYNGLKNINNFSILRNIINSINSNIKISQPKESKIKCDVLFTVENVFNHLFQCDKIFSIQHGFDYLYLGQRATQNTIYLCNSENYGKDIEARFKIKYIVPPLPIAYSTIEKQIAFANKKIETDKEIVFIFFPDKGFLRLVRKIIFFLKNKDFFIIIKQRRKGQPIPRNIGADLVVYDEIWYPSEAIFYPLISKIVMGFSCSAFTDLCEIGINFIDFAVLKHYKKSPNLYIKPNVNNYRYIKNKFLKNARSIINQISLKNNPNYKIIPEKTIKHFYINLLKNE
ncbi:MAG: hypothetical protein ACTSQP_17770 [Promethearchaeota archaeon]